MATLRLEIVTAEREVYSDTVDMVVAPGTEGILGILPRHAPLLTMLVPGELRLKKDGTETIMAVSGGFMEVLPDRVTILADTAERGEEIDEARALEAKRRAEAALAQRGASAAEQARAQAEMQRAMARLRVVERRRARRA